jgi:CyaY protein
MSEMTESEYQKLADAALKQVEHAFHDVDAEDVDLDRAGDVLTLTFKSGVRCVLNTQRPTRQLWLAANARAWHFSFDAATRRWMDDKGQGIDLFGAVQRIVKESAGIDVAITPAAPSAVPDPVH